MRLVLPAAGIRKHIFHIEIVVSFQIIVALPGDPLKQTPAQFFALELPQSVAAFVQPLAVPTSLLAVRAIL